MQLPVPLARQLAGIARDLFEQSKQRYDVCLALHIAMGEDERRGGIPPEDAVEEVVPRLQARVFIDGSAQTFDDAATSLDVAEIVGDP